ncbi:MAG: hypothetical protein SNJ60_01220 [Pseudanabaenaceae cyanobacterium]
MTSGAWNNQEPLSAELLADSADSLMDDLFAEVEKMLRVTSARNEALRTGSLTAPTPSRVEPPAAETNIPGGKLALRNDRPIALEKVDLSRLELPALVVPEPPAAVPPPPPPTPASDRPERFVDRLLTFAALFSVLTTVAMWSLQRGLEMWQKSEAPAPTAAEAVSADPVTAEFADKLRRSLASLNAPPPTPAPAPGTGPNVLPPINAVGGIQPIYIPVYQPPAVPPQALSPSAPVVSVPEPAPKPAPPPAIAVPPKATPTPVAAAPEVPALRYTLLGVLELGDRASAMVEGNGTVQTVRVGELVVGSNWILNSINGQEATFTRGREARTVGVGQKF